MSYPAGKTTRPEMLASPPAAPAGTVAPPSASDSAAIRTTRTRLRAVRTTYPDMAAPALDVGDRAPVPAALTSIQAPAACSDRRTKGPVLAEATGDIPPGRAQSARGGALVPCAGSAAPSRGGRCGRPQVRARPRRGVGARRFVRGDGARAEHRAVRAQRFPPPA